ncbi:MAG: hypothetical protein WC955_11275 [Elusimicrobiota bacterium]
MMKRFISLLLATLILLSYTPLALYAELNALTSMINAQTYSLGSAGTALFSGIPNIFTNPAGIRRNDKTVSALCVTHHIAMFNSKYDAVSYVFKLSGKSVAGTTAGITALLFDTGTESITGFGTVVAQKDTAVVASIAHNPGGKLTFGLNLKYVMSTLVEKYDSQILTVDTGAIFRLNPSTRIGATLQNYSQLLKPYQLPGETLVPLTLRAGISKLSKDERFIITADAVSVNNTITYSAGSEYALTRVITLRAGYNTAVGTYTLGGGIKISNFRLDYAYSPVKTFGNNHLASLTIEFY